jgi:hypothetical protein
MSPPYEIDIANKNQSELSFCLLTGTTLVIPNWIAQSVPSIWDLVRNALSGTFSVLVVLTGPKASTAMVANMEFEAIVPVLSCYADQYGDENPGFARRDMVSLSEARLARLEECILSGAWTHNLAAIE